MSAQVLIVIVVLTAIPFLLLNLLYTQFHKIRDDHIVSLSQAVDDARLEYNAQLARANMMDQQILTLNKRLEDEIKKNRGAFEDLRHKFDNTKAYIHQFKGKHENLLEANTEVRKYKEFLEGKTWELLNTTKQLRLKHTNDAQVSESRITELIAQVSTLQHRIDGKDDETFDLQNQITFKAQELHDMTVGWTATKAALEHANGLLSTTHLQLQTQALHLEDYDTALHTKQMEIDAYQTNTAGTIHALQGQISELVQRQTDLELRNASLGDDNAALAGRVEARSWVVESCTYQGDRAEDEVPAGSVGILIDVTDNGDSEWLAREEEVNNSEGVVQGEMERFEAMVVSEESVGFAGSEEEELDLANLEVIEGVEVEGPIAW